MKRVTVLTTPAPHDWKQGGKLLGKQWQPRDIVQQMVLTGWTGVMDLSDGIKVCLAESQGYDRAYNDNLAADGTTVVSRDVGIFQINIPASEIGTDAEEALYDVPTNLKAAFALWQKRGWEPWVSFTTNVFLRDTYLKRGVRGVANFLGEFDLQRIPTDTLAGTPYVHTLTNPVLDYEYRVIDQHNTITAAYKSASGIKNLTTLAQVKTKASQVAIILQQALNVPKQ
jgi:hypothetical protein